MPEAGGPTLRTDAAEVSKLCRLFTRGWAEKLGLRSTNLNRRVPRMNVHKNARLTPSGRALLAQRIETGWTTRSAAEAAGVSVRTARKWLGRHRLGGERRHHDRSSAPRRCPRRTEPRRMAEIEALRRQRMTGPQIARMLGMARSTVGLILRRLGPGPLALLDPKPPIVRYERSRPGEMIHPDIKKLGRFERAGPTARPSASSRPPYANGPTPDPIDRPTSAP
jgi:transposase